MDNISWNLSDNPDLSKNPYGPTIKYNIKGETVQVQNMMSLRWKAEVNCLNYLTDKHFCLTHWLHNTYFVDHFLMLIIAFSMCFKVKHIWTDFSLFKCSWFAGIHFYTSVKKFEIWSLPICDNDPARP